MSGSLKLGIMLILGVIVLAIVVKIATAALSFLVPLAIVAGIGLILFGLVSRKAIGGSGRRYLP